MPGNPVATGMTLVYSDLSHTQQTITFKAKSDSSRKTAMVWIAAMQKVCSLATNIVKNINFYKK